jgi:hypothetical protein
MRIGDFYRSPGKSTVRIADFLKELHLFVGQCCLASRSEKHGLVCATYFGCAATLGLPLRSAQGEQRIWRLPIDNPFRLSPAQRARNRSPVCGPIMALVLAFSGERVAVKPVGSMR